MLSSLEGYICMLYINFFFFKHKTAYEMRISDWSSDVCSSDLLAETITTDYGLTKADAKKIVDAVFVAITDAAATGAEISLPGFGKFKVKDSPAREGRNPANGETIQQIGRAHV